MTIPPNQRLYIMCILLYKLCILQARSFLIIFLTAKMSKRIENYLLKDQIGQGAYGNVYKGADCRTGETVAIKQIALSKFEEIPKLYELTMNEIQILSKVRCENIIRFIEILRTCNHYYFIYEFCNEGTLEDLQKKQHFRFSNQQLDTILRQLLNAFRVLSEHQILHRDLKPQNILFHSGVLKVADFGFCKQLTRDCMAQSQVGSPLYMAPEVLNGHSYDSLCDVWSVGILFYEIVEGTLPFQANNIPALLAVVMQDKPLVFNNQQAHSKFREIIRRCLTVPTQQRITWAQLIQIMDSDQPKQQNYFAPSLGQQQQSYNHNVFQNITNQPQKEHFLRLPRQESRKEEQKSLLRKDESKGKVRKEEQKGNAILRGLTAQKYLALFLMDTVKQLKDHGGCPKSVLGYLLKEVEKEQRRMVSQVVDSNYAVQRVAKQQALSPNAFLQSEEYKQFINILVEEHQSLRKVLSKLDDPDPKAVQKGVEFARQLFSNQHYGLANLLLDALQLDRLAPQVTSSHSYAQQPWRLSFNALPTNQQIDLLNHKIHKLLHSDEENQSFLQ